MRQDDLLVEIGTEELPPKTLRKLGQAFCELISNGLNKAELTFTDSRFYASPRRLAVYVSGLDYLQQDKTVEKRGPAVRAAFDDEGNPTKAAQGWAKGLGIAPADADRLKTDKGEWLVYQAEVKGQALPELLPALVKSALSALPVPKMMRWGNSEHPFIRPVHTLCMLYGDQLIAGELFGIKASQQLQGHRFHHPQPVELKQASDYVSCLKEAYVIADFDQRRNTIQQGLQRVAEAHNAKIEVDEDLLDEVTALVEWPVVLTAEFDKDFLQVPKEALIYTMKGDQKYFPLLTSDGQLLPVFAFVTNIDSKDPEQIVNGNERVIRPRLADAEFFFNTDKKQSLESRLDSLETVLFQKQLGSLKDKAQRIASLAQSVARELGAEPKFAYRAGLLSKADLMTQMVMEFPEVQGTMGEHYAIHDSEHTEIATAIGAQYLPRFSGDTLPDSPVSCAVALADKLDTLVGIFGIGQLPKGDKDPFALRRAAIGLLRICVEKKLALDLAVLIDHSMDTFGDILTNKNVKQQVLEFVLGRFRAWYQEQGIETDVVQAVLSRQPTSPLDFDARIRAVQHFKSLDSALALAAANKRVANILAKNAHESKAPVNPDLLSEKAEVDLAQHLQRTEQDVADAMARLDYKLVLEKLSALHQVVDDFFDQVMVMAEDERLRNNRLALLQKLRSLFLQVADISVLN
ncbi:glycine--tRNA ligase subunit beta [Lacimicrobium alkaliphilum]|uniref:Glycine--tRNA ligase beta subunit n=1 Tax=Lacimicrobium alkaliphilum TaxID=1526571 RepID=A0ABQ1RIV6_9ALTE|nr:glycine--tRNA ligase subunit beta [Lacimicrobium alkaliphilum]GGD71918.1 glycine--tRNA ligase beta subunit [Lacimicrobium alkaliphilum]